MDVFRHSRNRDAWAVIRGFVYQVDLTIRRWLDLAPDEILELECGEDIDRISASLNAGDGEDSRQLEQVKHRQAPITLVSPPAVFAIACAVEHRAANPHLKLRFRFTTNSRATKERFSRHPTPGILVWENLRGGRLKGDAAVAISVIRTILKGTSKPAKLHNDAWAVFRGLVDQGGDEELLDLIRTFEWGTGTDDAPSLAAGVKQSLLDSGRATDLQYAQGLHERLFFHVFKLICRAGRKQLTASNLSGLLALPTLTEADQAILARMKLTLTQLESRVEVGELQRWHQGALIEQIGSQVQALAKQQGVLASIRYGAEDVDLDIPPPCAHLCPRNAAGREVTRAVGGHTWTAIHGSSWTGKTQLVAVVARSWDRFHGWVRLRDLSIPYACQRLDRALEVASLCLG